MGYFSRHAVNYVFRDYDHSYTSPEMRLLERLDALEERLHELMTQRTGKRDDGVCFSESNLRYVLPKHFLSVSDVEKAIDLAQNELAERYGIYVHGKPVETLPEMDEITGMQISFLDMLSMQTFQKQAAAA